MFILPLFRRAVCRYSGGVPGFLCRLV